MGWMRNPAGFTTYLHQEDPIVVSGTSPRIPATDWNTEGIGSPPDHK